MASKMEPRMRGNIAAARAEAPHFERVVWYREPHLRRLYSLSIFLLVASVTTGYDSMLVNTQQQMDFFKRYFGDNIVDSQRLGVLINMFNIGSIVSFFPTPWLADTLGRRPTIALGCAIMTLGAFVSAFCNGYAMYIGGRFVLGFGNSLAQMSSPMLLTEICHPQHRGPVTAVYNCLWNLGSVVVSCVGWGTRSVQNDWSWRSITLLQALPSLVQLVGIWFLPESPRFLVRKDRADEALAVLAKHHAGGDAAYPTVQFQFREIKEVMTADKAAARTTSYLDFLRNRGNRWRLAIILSLGVISQYSGNALFSNYIDIIYTGAGINDEGKKLALSAGKTILDLSVSIGAALCVDKIGRRPLFLSSMTGMVCSFALWTTVGAVYENSHETNSAAGNAQIAFVWLFGVFYAIGFSGLLVAYALEVLPYHLRAKGMMIMNVTIQAVLALGNQTNKLAWGRLPNHWNFMLFYTLWNFCELVFVYFFYVETKGPTLEEIARIFDGDDAAVAHIDFDRLDREIHQLEPEHEPDVDARNLTTEKTAA